MINILTSWLTLGPIEQQLISFNHHNILTGECFSHQVAFFHQQLIESQHEKWLLSCDNSELFAIGLCAALIAGKEIILPSSIQPANLLALNNQFDAILSDKALAPQKTFILLEKVTDAPRFPWPKSANWGSFTLFTSGSSGQPKAVKKTLAQLDFEVSTLESTFAQHLPQCSIISTVSHQHIYGLLFKILWPLASRRPFLSDLIEYPETLSYYSHLFSQLCLISSPAHLSRLPASLDYQPQMRAPSLVFSSGGPLSYEAAQGIKQCYSTLPIEIFGSTETGGIAYRRQYKEQQTWKTFTPIHIKQDENDGALWLKSPYIEHDNWMKCNDKIKIIENNEFILQGRLDRIVKIEEKRLSLVEMETLLHTHPMINLARLLVIEQPKTQLAAVIELSESGKKYLKAKGKLSLNNIFKSYLLTQFERVILPKRWRYPEKMPVNTQGKQVQSQLLALFTHD
ncbi:AMP-binding protein [uncultured Shewanella sp.]|uniref:AMP-binding protein n=1 Tax=uncultured Shewanella sp. TaxID=173975 RepID=UPI0026090DBE|nr:AMP-binding protein [uncultured Shewanella sp.]